MNAAASYTKQLVARQGLFTFGAFVVLALLAPLVLRLTPEAGIDTATHAVGVGALAAALVAVLTSLLARRHRFTLRAVAMGSSAIEPADLEALRRFSYRAIVLQLATMIAASVSLATTWLRPFSYSSELARELATLGTTVACAVAVPSLVLAQRLMGQVLEFAPIDTVTAQLEALDERDVPRRRSRQNLVYAVVVPVALVGVGGALASYAHLRFLTEQARTVTALVLARGVIGSGTTRTSAGQQAAMRVARKRGYDVVLHETGFDPLPNRSPETIVHTIVIERGSATVSYSSELPLSSTIPLAAVAFGFVLLASAAAVALAKLVSRDLGGAAEHLRTLGTERVLTGDDEATISARFEVVAKLEQAALALADRFRVFAAAQERALESKETARRMRGLLFASVSHDLKTPLNAIVGFADALDREALSPPQRESLDLISTRGRELVALIETILDAARVEAGQLSLVKKRTSVAGLVYLANQRARELVGDVGDLRIEMAEGLPAVTVDATHVSRAIAVVIAHALRSAAGRSGVAVRASVAAGGKQIRVEVDHGEAQTDASELRALFTQQQTSRAKGLTLGLSVARSIIEMHGGSIEVTGATGESTVVSALLPV
ncbi:MAG: hypothetical protein JNL21_09785 [Myxococcales bacterium]|nr:hypothetical protein [Myxococcales bacterium]